MADLVVHQFLCLSDNYGYLLHDPRRNLTAAIDTPDASRIEQALAETGWKLTHIFNTHHHLDHAGGNEALKAKWACTIVGSRSDASRIPGIDVQVGDGEHYDFGDHRCQVFDVSGHTRGHVAYYFPADGLLFCGDALFALGCGRLFEGTADMMWNSLQKLLTLPDATKVYCAHEYTESNARFAVTVEPGNEELMRRFEAIAELRAQGKPTVPSDLGLEKRTNPFLRPTSRNLQETLGMSGADPVAVFAETRARKDRFR